MLKRDEVKYIRDLAKSAYKKGSECRICGTHEELQFHHFYSISKLWKVWKEENNIGIITDVDDMEIYRLMFKKAHKKELYDEAVTLCKFHHMDRLHGLYGPSPPLSTAEKQKKWVEKQRDKYYGKTT